MSAALAQPDPGADLIGSYRRFGPIGPVYEVMGPDESGFMTVCIVESGKMARYPVEEIRKDPPA